MRVESQPPASPVVSEREEVSRSYVVGREQVTPVGDPLVKVVSFRVTETRQFDIAVADRAFEGACEVRGPAVRFRAEAGGEMRIRGSTVIEGVRYHIIEVGSMSGAPIGLAVDAASGHVHSSCIWDNRRRGWILVGRAAFYSNPKPIFSISKPVVRREPGDVNFELIYSGISKQTVHLLYREYTRGALARPAFFQNLSYDLGESDVIAFRSFRIKVARATNQDIRYTVISD